MSRVPSRLAAAARRVLTLSDRLNRLVWPSPGDGLRRRRDGALVVSSVFRTLSGREPGPAERARILEHSRRRPDIDALIADLADRREILERAVTAAPRLVRHLMEDDITAEEGLGGDRSKPSVLYLHIMKTAGTSLSTLLGQWAGPAHSRVGIPLDDLVVMPTPLLARMQAVAGHIPFEAIEIMPVSFRTVTVLRDPLERTLSHYREIRRRHHEDLTLDEFLHNEVFDVPSGNYQARSLAHTIDLARAWVTYSPMRKYLEAGGEPDQLYPLQALFDSTPIMITEDELLDRAMRNLSTIDYVGLTERLDQLTGRLAVLFHVPAVAPPRLNVSRPAESTDLPGHLRKLIHKRTEVDRELYEHAREASADS